MSLPFLYSQPTDDNSWRAWSFNHAATHYTVIGGVHGGSGADLTINWGGSGSVNTIQSVDVASGGSQYTQYTAVAVFRSPSVVVTEAQLVPVISYGQIISVTVQNAGVYTNQTPTLQIEQSIPPFDQFPLDPMDRTNLTMWLYNHQLMHAQMNVALGTPGYDLLYFSLDNPDIMQEWLQMNGTEHLAWNTILGV